MCACMYMCVQSLLSDLEHLILESGVLELHNLLKTLLLVRVHTSKEGTNEGNDGVEGPATTKVTGLWYCRANTVTDVNM